MVRPIQSVGRVGVVPHGDRSEKQLPTPTEDGRSPRCRDDRPAAPPVRAEPVRRVTGA